MIVSGVSESGSVTGPARAASGGESADSSGRLVRHNPALALDTPRRAKPAPGPGAAGMRRVKTAFGALLCVKTRRLRLGL